MSEFDEKDRPSTAALARLGKYALAFTAGGTGLFVLQIVSRFRLLGLAAGGILCVTGIVLRFKKDFALRRAGIIATTAGTLLIVSKLGILFVRAIAGSLIIMLALALFALGVWNGIQFIIGIKKLS